MRELKLNKDGSDEDEVYLKEKLSEIGYSSLFNFNMNRSKLMNIPREQFMALTELFKNKNITIRSPDNGSGVVILNRSNYVTKMEEILKDTTKFKKCGGQDTYEYKVPRKIERKVRNFLRDKVKKPG